jgi:hypothetical protein
MVCAWPFVVLVLTSSPGYFMEYQKEMSILVYDEGATY